MTLRSLHLRRFAAPAIVLTLTATLAACGSDAASSGDTTAVDASTASTASIGAEAATGSAVTLNAGDIEFAQGMIGHHEQAVEMAEYALDPNSGADTEIIDLAMRIQAAQEPEIVQMTGWLTAAGEPITMDMVDGHDMSSMDGMMSAEQLDALAVATGAEFDLMWLQMMIAHHEGAISQAEAVKASSANPDILLLADQIIAAQQGELTEMQLLVGS